MMYDLSSALGISTATEARTFHTHAHSMLAGDAPQTTPGYSQVADASRPPSPVTEVGIHCALFDLDDGGCTRLLSFGK